LVSYFYVIVVYRNERIEEKIYDLLVVIIDISFN